MKSNYKWILVLIFCGVAAGASNKVGNGGNVIWCKSEPKEILSLLDFYEDSVAENKETDAKKIVDEQFKRLAMASPQLSTQYLERAQKIWDEIDFKNEVELTEIPDSKHLFKPSDKNCKVQQIAIRKKLVVGKEKRFLIRKDLWEKLAPLHQAGLIAHEIIYEHFAKLGEEDSVNVRKINRMLFAKDFSAKEFWNLIKELELPIYPK